MIITRGSDHHKRKTPAIWFCALKRTKPSPSGELFFETRQVVKIAKPSRVFAKRI